MTEATKKAVLMVHLDPDLKKRLAMQAVEEGKTMSTIVREALGIYMKVSALLGRYPMTEEEKQRHVEIEQRKLYGQISGPATDRLMTFNEEA